MQKLLSLKASAGSGKTFSLANRYISLLFQDANPSEIVAITFTNKAASEMDERIVKYLRNIEADENFLDRLVENTGLTKEEIIKKSPFILDKFLKSDIHIMTIDSFLQKIARKFGYYGGVDIDFDISKDNLDDVFSQFIDSVDIKEFESLVKFAKQENILEFFENLYVKDKELQVMENGKWRMENGDLISSFDLENSIKVEIEKLRDNILSMIDKCSDTAKKFILQDEMKFYFSDRLKTILNNNTIKYPRSIFNKCYSEILEAKFFEYVDLIKKYIYLKLLNKEEYILSTIFSLYQKYKNTKWAIKQKENYLDFKDVEHLVYKILVEDKLNSDFLYFRLDSRINHILIDEFQDTSITQWKIISPLVDEIKSGVGQHLFKTFFYVGDVKQAIYRFRGGSSELFDYVYNELRDFGMKQESLDTNYRSGEVIVNFVNEVFNLQEKANNSGGYVEIKDNKLDESNSSSNHKRFDWRSNLKEVLTEMFDKGVRDSDIAILVYGNDDILEVADFIKENFNKQVVTSTTKNIINQRSVRAVVDLMKYLYFKEKIYLFNFLTFIGKEFDENFEVDIKINRPSIMIKNILDKYNLWDVATLKLLEYSIKYDDIVDFVYDIDNCELALNSDIDGINVLTIHKSKGLEFKNVVVIDRMKRKTNRGIKLLYNYDGIELKNIRYKQKGMEVFDDKYKKIIENEEQLELRDRENVEYVAYTRPKQSLFILRNEDENYSDFERLKNYKGETKLGELVVEQKEENKQDNRKFELEFNYYGKQNYVKEKEYKPNDYDSIYKGIALHSLFEMDEESWVLNKYGIYVDFDEVRGVYNRAKEFSEYKEKLNGTIYKELPFVVELDGEIKEGIIDLMIESDEEIVIIDYKTTKPNDERGYIEQVKFYKRSIEKLKNKKTKGYLFYIQELEIKEVK